MNKTVHKNYADWEELNPESYVADNYLFLSKEDKQILQNLALFYSMLPPKGYSIVEIGAGPNLYPIFAASNVASKVINH